MEDLNTASVIVQELLPHTVIAALHLNTASVIVQGYGSDPLLLSIQI